MNRGLRQKRAISLTPRRTDSTMHPDQRMVQNAATNASQPTALLGRMASLADATRLRLLRLLERHELGVVELCDVLQLPQSTVSRHLKVLGDQGWATSRRQGTTRLYRMILDELDAPARKLWLLAREQTESWATFQQDSAGSRDAGTSGTIAPSRLTSLPVSDCSGPHLT